MDDLVGSSLQERKSTKRAKTKKHPTKVVYISNPMKFKTSASQFRALVQELTGQDAELPDPAKFVDGGCHVVGGHQTVVTEASKSTSVVEEGSSLGDPGGDVPESANALVEYSSDDIFMPEMLESLSGLIPSRLLYETSPPFEYVDKL